MTKWMSALPVGIMYSGSYVERYFNEVEKVFEWERRKLTLLRVLPWLLGAKVQRAHSYVLRFSDPKDRSGYQRQNYIVVIVVRIIIA